MNGKRPTSSSDTKANDASAPVHSGAQAKLVRGRWGKALLVGLAIVTIALVGIMLTSLKNPRHVPARVFLMTEMRFGRQTPGPWLRGNSFSLAPASTWIPRGPIGYYVREYAPNSLTGGASGWSVINMHAENFSEIVRQLKLESVEILVLDKNSCLIVDARIPRKWFRQRPDVVIWPLTAEKVMAEHPEQFNLPVAAAENR